MNNNIHRCAGRRRPAGTFHPFKIINGSLARVRPLVAVSTQHAAASLCARWSRNALTGVLECHWVPEAPVEPYPRMKAVRRISVARVQRRFRRADLRPPSCQSIHG